MKRTKYLIKSVLALIPVCGVIYLAHQFLYGEELQNQGEMGILLGILSMLCKESYTWFFNGSKDEDE